MSEYNLYAFASSIGFKSSLCKFSIKAKSSLSLSEAALLTIALISVNPASFEALNLLSPAISSYSPGTTDCTTIIGSISPFCFIDSAKSFNFSSLNTNLG